MRQKITCVGVGLGGTGIRILVFLVASLGLGSLLSVGALVDVLKHRDLKRRLREERKRRARSDA